MVSPSQPYFPLCTLKCSLQLPPTPSVFSINPMVDVEHFSFPRPCAKLAAAACAANVQWNYTCSRVECFFRSRTIHAPELKSFSYTFKIKLCLETERCVQFFVSKRKIFRVADADDFGIEMSIVDCIQFRWHGSRGPVACDI